MSILEANDRSERLPLVPPIPPRLPPNAGFFRRTAAMRQTVLATWEQRAYQEEIIQSRLLRRSSFIVNAPNAIRHILVDNSSNYTRTPSSFRLLRPLFGQGVVIAEGPAWKHQRRAWAPAFTPRSLATLVPQMIEVADETISKLHDLRRQPIDARDLMEELMLEIVGRTLLSLRMGAHWATLRNFLREYSVRMARPDFFDLLLPPSWPSPQDVPRARFRKRWTRFISTLVAERRARGKGTGGSANDLFDMLDAVIDPQTGAPTDRQLVDEIGTMFLAGHHTTASTLFWGLYLLALDPASQDRIAAEAKAVPLNDGSNVERLKYTRATIDETLRLYPPVFLMTRAAIGPDTIAGREIRAHDLVFIAPWILHRHHLLWRDPDAFIPSRFLPPSPPQDRFAYLPFGAGPRVCIGANFALIVTTLVLAKMIRAFQVTLLDEKPVIPLGVLTTQPDYSPMFAITPR
jgi:cytochrome P450